MSSKSATISNMQESKKKLFACASEWYNPKTKEWVAEIVHVSAVDATEARKEFHRSNQRMCVRLVAVGPLVGVWGEEKKDEDGKPILVMRT